jgi:uncharacterized protein YaaW (UPF0174 family)
MPELRLIADDHDLVPLLCAATDEELDPILEILLKKGGLTSELDTTDAYLANRPHHSKYTREIAAEIQLYGGNTVFNRVRGHGVRYREIVEDVGKKVKAGVESTDSTEEMESKIVAKLLSDASSHMSEAEREVLLESIGKEFRVGCLPGKQIPLAVLQAAIRVGGFQSYVLTLQVANAAARQLLGRGLGFAVNMTLTRYMAVLAGPIGWVLTAIWFALDVAGPAFRVTVPTVLLVAHLRQKFTAERAGFLLCGRSGHGKSSLINALSRQERAGVSHVEPGSSRWTPYDIVFSGKYLVTAVDTRGIFESTTPDGALSDDAVQELKNCMVRHNPGVVMHLVSAPEARNMSEDLKILGQALDEFRSALKVHPTKILVITKADTIGNPRNWPSRESYRKVADLMNWLANDVVKDSECQPILPASHEVGFVLSGKNQYGYSYIIPVCCRGTSDLWNLETLESACEGLIQDLRLERGVQATGGTQGKQREEWWIRNHRFTNGVCEHCGHSEKAARHFGWDCKK